MPLAAAGIICLALVPTLGGPDHPLHWAVTGSLQKDDQPSLQNYADLGTGIIPQALFTSIEISLVTAIAGGILGFLIAYAVILGGLPRFLRTAVSTFSGVASNFAGVPLALAFVFTLGQLGVITTFLRESFGFNIYDTGFKLSDNVSSTRICLGTEDPTRGFVGYGHRHTGQYASTLIFDKSTNISCSLLRGHGYCAREQQREP